MRIAERGKRSTGITEQEIFVPPGLFWDAAPGKSQKGSERFEILTGRMDGFSTWVWPLRQRLDDAVNALASDSRDSLGKRLIDLELKCHPSVREPGAHASTKPKQSEISAFYGACGQAGDNPILEDHHQD